MIVLDPSVEMLILGFLIGLTGALAPGPTLVATINASLKNGWGAGPRVTLGHMVVELVMVLLIITGVSIGFGEYSLVIACIGGFSLLVFGGMTLWEARNSRIIVDEMRKDGTTPLLAGIFTSISNPYFWIWWLTVGSALLLGAYNGGLVLALAFILGHWASDLGWFTLVAVGIGKGRFLFSDMGYRLILVFCGISLIFFGMYYLHGLCALI